METEIETITYPTRDDEVVGELRDQVNRVDHEYGIFSRVDKIQDGLCRMSSPHLGEINEARHEMSPHFHSWLTIIPQSGKIII